jgi:DNA gyrase subunit A
VLWVEGAPYTLQQLSQMTEMIANEDDPQTKRKLIREYKDAVLANSDYIENLFMTTSHHYLLFITNLGRMYRLKAYEIPEASRTSRGTAIINLLQLMPDERISAVIPIREFEEDKYLLMATANGTVKKTALSAYANIRKTGLIAISLREDDELIDVTISDNTEDVFLVSQNGQCIRFSVTDIRETGRSSMGVRGIRLDKGDRAIGMQMSTQGEHLLFASEKGIGKRTEMDEFPIRNRGGKGVKCYKIVEKTGKLIGVKAVDPGEEVMLITTEGILIRMPVDGISIIGRDTSGVKLVNMKEDVTVASLAKVKEEDVLGTSKEE